MSAEPAEKTELEILEDRLKELETLSVRPNSDAARSCRHFITIVMCTFAPPKLAIAMKALLTFPEQHRVTTKELSEKMKLDRKQMREYLANLKSGGYVLETTGVTEWAQKTRHRSGGNRGYGGKAAQYHVDYKYFIMMTKFRLSRILKRLNAQQEKEDDTGDGYVCSNEACYCCYKVQKLMDLILEQQAAGNRHSRISKQSHFTCSECGEPLIDAQKFYDNQNATLTKKMQFNLQMATLRKLLTATEEKVKREGEAMSVEISKLEDQMERLREGSGHGAYKAGNLSFGAGDSKNAKTGTGLAHLDRIGRRGSYKKKAFLCNIEDDKKEKEGTEGRSEEKDEKTLLEEKRKRQEEEREFQKMQKYYIQYIREQEIEVDGNGGSERGDVDDDDGDVGMYPMVKVKVNGDEVLLQNVLSDWSKYEDEMTINEWNEYQRQLNDMGLLEID